MNCKGKSVMSWCVCVIWSIHKCSFLVSWLCDTTKKQFEKLYMELKIKNSYNLYTKNDTDHFDRPSTKPVGNPTI